MLLDKLAIDKQRNTLSKENQFFKNLLKQYLDGVSVNDDVMSNPNPLLVVNDRVKLNRQVEKLQKGDKPVVEGIIEVRTIAKNKF